MCCGDDVVSAALWQLQVNYEPSSWTGLIGLVSRTQKLHIDLNREAKDCFVCACVFSKQMASMCHSVPMLKVEEWPLPGESLTGDTVRALIDRVSDIYCDLAAPLINDTRVQRFLTSGSAAKDQSEGSPDD